MVVDNFKQVGDLEMALDSDQLFGPMVDIVTALLAPATLEEWASLPDDDES
ncbi:hypothetical protein EV589_2195 [Mycobacterium sp. BK558]|nr:hypothetical protein EV589_2195 [Mycobacterium sp. BK558]